MKLVQEIGAISLGIGSTPIGILTVDYYPIWACYVGAMCKVEWVISGHDLPGQMEGDSVGYEIENLVDGLEDVEV